MGRLDGRIALITGASRGIGREIALAFAREGADIAANFNQRADEAASLKEAITALGRRVITPQADIGQPDQITRMFEQTMESFGRIDVLVNNAGFLNIHAIADMPMSAWDELMAVHLRGTFLTSQTVLPQMIERRDGKIINVASQLAYKGRAGLAHYCAAKAGIIAFTRVLALEVSRFGINANCIAPGQIATEIVPRSGPPDLEEAARFADSLPMGRIGSVDEVAPTAVFLASSESSYYVGQVLGPNGGDVML